MPKQTPLSPPVFHILLALADSERHGYGIMQEIAERTHQRVKMGPGTLYGALKRMLDDGWIEELESDGDDERRRSYRLTATGRKVARAEAQRLEELVVAAQAKRLLSQARPA
ncbi:MAG: helix-turn-helix transcriptional regulator [Gemmatimonadota bacterium]